MDAYVQLAKEAIFSFRENPQQLFAYPDYIPEIMKQKKAGVFVSLHHYNNLRGCIGTYSATQQNIALEIIANAISAAFNDPRFKPLTLKELTEVEITVDILSPLEKIDSITLLNPKIFGVLVEKSNKTAILLPDLQGIDSIEKQIDILLKKANINDGIYGCSFYRFTTDRHW